MDQFLLPMVLASDAVISDGELIGDPTEGALVALAAKGGVDAGDDPAGVPADRRAAVRRGYKLMATFHRMTDEEGREVVRCFVKGAPDQLLARAGTVYDADHGAVPVTATSDPLPGRERTARQPGTTSHRDCAQGLRRCTFDPGADLLPLVDGLELLALVGIVDPPRPSAKASIATARDAGIRVRMITGDHAVTAAAIADQLGIEGRVAHRRRVRGS